MRARLLPDKIRTMLACLGLAFFGTVSASARDIQVIALSGDPVPGLTDIYFDDFTFDISSGGVPSFNQAGKVAFLAQLRDESTLLTEKGVFAAKGSQLDLVAKTRDQAPGVEAGTLLLYFTGPPSLSEDGRVAFSATTTGSPINGSDGIWVQDDEAVTVLVRSGEEAPGFDPPRTLGGVRAPKMNSRGDVAFIGSLSRGFFPGIFTNVSGELRKIAFPGDPAPGLTRSTFNPFSERSSFVIDETGSTIFANTTGTGFVSYKIWKDSQLLVAPGREFEASSPLGVGPRELTSLTRQPVLHPAGTYAFLGLSESIPPVSEDPVLSLFSGKDGSIEEIVRVGQSVPGQPDDVTFASFQARSVNALGHTVFTATTSISTWPSIWSEQDGVLHLVAQKGDTVPGDPAHMFQLLSFPQINSFNQTAFLADVSLGGSQYYQGIWAEDRSGQLQLIAGPGTEVEVAPGVTKMIDVVVRPGVLTDEVTPMYFNDRGQVLFRAVLEDGTEGIFISNKIAVPEPTTLWLVGSVLGSLILFRQSAVAVWSAS